MVLLTSVARADDRAARVVLLVNSADADSLRIARHYAEARGVPVVNIVALPMPLRETITWREFVTTIWQPLQEVLVCQKWIDAIPMIAVDALGRRKYAVSGHRVSYLVVCRGVPLRIDHDPAQYAPALPFTQNQQYRTNCGAVDSELSLLTQPTYPINAFFPNPLFRNSRPTDIELGAIIKVSRLDGPTADDANHLVDLALTAERTGLLGRAYVDIGGNHPDGDVWLEAAVKKLSELGFTPDVERSPSTFPATARFDAPVLYFGWYAGTVNGPFSLPDFRFPPGAVALHIHSYSAATLRSTSSGWCGPFVSRGVTATVGNVFEPYLQLTHHPDLLLRALARGDTFGDAVYFSQPVLSWQPIAIGDPLYRPFALDAEEQWKILDRLPPTFAGYAVLRRMHLLDFAHKPAEATLLALSMQSKQPSFAVGFALASRLDAVADHQGAIGALAFAAYLEKFRTDEWGLAHDAAALLETLGASDKATALYRHLLLGQNIPAPVLVPWVREARATALHAGDNEQASIWQKVLGELIMQSAPAGNY